MYTISTVVSVCVTDLGYRIAHRVKLDEQICRCSTYAGNGRVVPAICL